MKIVITSDIHDNITNLKTCLDWCKKEKIETMICCGDLASLDTLEILSKNFPGQIHYVSGNMDYIYQDDADDFSNISHHGEVGRVEIAGLNIGMCHQPFKFDRVLALGECDIVFYGHTHKPWEENKNGVRFVNPGTLSAMFSLATFAVFDTERGEMELKVLNKL
ncbi:hypothetical protein C0583_05180 [Candidatus Parcubacteria bacterium]|nr:MAG: hypothetical protein C0583_05180 [Candidatus Parcubacteria bacterium]